MVCDLEFSRGSYINFSTSGLVLELCTILDNLASQVTILGKQAFRRFLGRGT